MSRVPSRHCLHRERRHPSLRGQRTSPARVCSPFAYSPVSPRPRETALAHTNSLGLGRGLSLPQGTQVPEIIQRALDSSPAGRRSTSKRDSMQRKRSWWLPYVVLEFDKNEILIDALGGDLSKPEWNYRADLCVPSLLSLTLSIESRPQRCVSYFKYLGVSIPPYCAVCARPG